MDQNTLGALGSWSLYYGVSNNLRCEKINKANRIKYNQKSKIKNQKGDNYKILNHQKNNKTRLKKKNKKSKCTTVLRGTHICVTIKCFRKLFQDGRCHICLYPYLHSGKGKELE